jgi:lipopolysaccharide export system protein LptC
MTLAPMPARGPRPGVGSRAGRLMGTAPRRRIPSKGKIARRRWMVAIVKRFLPLVALAILASIAFWPEIVRDADRARISYRRGAVEAQSGQIIEPRYHGVDEHNRPYTVTAALAKQVGPERVDMTSPKGDVLLANGSWLMVQSREGVYMQHAQQLDLSGDVTLYRDDGTTMQTSAAAVDLRAGAAASAEMTHTEGPFGILDAQGFALTDSGNVVHFTGPGHLILNAGKHQ